MSGKSARLCKALSAEANLARSVASGGCGGTFSRKSISYHRSLADDDPADHAASAPAGSPGGQPPALRRRQPQQAFRVQVRQLALLLVGNGGRLDVGAAEPALEGLGALLP